MRGRQNGAGMHGRSRMEMEMEGGVTVCLFIRASFMATFHFSFRIDRYSDDHEPHYHA